MIRHLWSLAACAMILGTAGSAPAGFILNFSNITNNDPADALLGESQLTVEVHDRGIVSGVVQVGFEFRNNGPADMTIREVYFDDGTLLGIAQIINGAGVNFSQGANPPDLPGGENLDPPFQVTAGFLSQSTGGNANGVDPGEFVEIRFDLIDGQTYADTLNALQLGGAPGGLRIGIHVGNFDGGGSESFVNDITAVPVPPAIAMVACGLIPFAGAAGIRRLRRKTA